MFRAMGGGPARIRGPTTKPPDEGEPTTADRPAGPAGRGAGRGSGRGAEGVFLLCDLASGSNGGVFCIRIAL